MAYPDYSGVEATTAPVTTPEIQPAPTSITAFVGVFKDGPMDTATPVASFAEFERIFGGLDVESETSYAVMLFFANGGTSAVIVRVDEVHPDALVGNEDRKTGIYALLDVDVNLLCIPDLRSLNDVDALVVLATARVSGALLIADPTSDISSVDEMLKWVPLTGVESSRHIPFSPRVERATVAVYFPSLLVPDPLNGNEPRDTAASGAIAGMIARTDQQGVWAAPSGTTATLQGAVGLTYLLTDDENARLASSNVNSLRTFEGLGNVVWGARTMDTGEPDNKYVPLRRLAVFIEASILQGMHWASSETNNPELWARIASSVSSFLTKIWKQGALRGGNRVRRFLRDL
jgi:phage tail sheath protein FI